MTHFKFNHCGRALALAMAIGLAGCGGGGGDSGGTSSSSVGAAASTVAVVYAGPISGFGSVIVNGARFSSVGATLRDDDGQSIQHSQLKLGMTVRVSGDVDDDLQQGSARELELVHGTRGTITAINTSTGSLSLLGQTVTTNAATAYQGVANLAALALGQAVEVFGAQQADGSLLATLVEVKALSALSLSGVVSGLTATGFNVGALSVSYRPEQVSGTLADGKRVRIKAALTALTGNVLTASSVQVASAAQALGNGAVGTRLKLRGVAEAAPVAGALLVSGTPVQVANARIVGGLAIVPGQFIEVKGSWDGSTLQATQVELEGYRESQLGGRNELYGSVSSLNGSLALVNGVTVDLSAAVFSHGTLAQVAVGSYVEVKGNMIGSTLQANRVELKTAGNASGVSYEQYGQVAGFVSAANFTLNGLSVDASQARFEHGSAAALANGVYLEVKGAQDSRGVFVAAKVEIKNGHDD